MGSFSQTHINNGSESIGTLSSSSDDFRPLDDFKPLLAKQKNKNKKKVHFKNVPTKRTKNIHEFRQEINALKTESRQNSNLESDSGNLLMTQIQRDHEEQDEVLEDMHTVLQRLEIMSKDIGNEIVEQDQMLEETNEQADNTYDRMKKVDKMMNNLMEQNGLTPCRVIMILLGIVVVLLILILWS